MNLRHAGYEVLEAEDGEQGIEVALEHLPDAVVLDLMMPRADGFEVLRVLARPSRRQRGAGTGAHGRQRAAAIIDSATSSVPTT